MKTTVIHIKHARGGPNEVYIGRAGHGHDGYFGNPCVVGENCPVCLRIHSRREDTIHCFRVLAELRWAKNQEYRERVRALKGKTLVCFCKPGPCHGDVLKQLADETAT